jgi:Zn-dependent protease with chaperone function
MSEIAIPTPQATPSSVERWETEIPLLVLVAIASLALWTALVVSIIGIFYALFFALFFFLAQLGFIAHLRGSAVKLGPEQLPALHARVVAISRRLGLAKVPDAYVMQAGGSLNALATKLFGSSFIVLFSDLLEACEDDPEAADFIIAHELGHLKAGHLRFQWFLILGRLVPFLGGAYSRACEYTADRFGFAAVGDRRSAVHGLTVLAAGGSHAKQVNLPAFVEQRRDMTSTLMTLGRWMATHPPIVDRVAEADKALAPEKIVAPAGAIGALALIAVVFLVPVAGGGVLFWQFAKKMQTLGAAQQQTTAATESAGSAAVAEDDDKPQIADAALAAEVAKADLARLASVIEQYKRKYGKVPGDSATLYAAARMFDPNAGSLLDPFDGYRYGYGVSEDGTYELSSYGNQLPEYASVLTVKGK